MFQLYKFIHSDKKIWLKENLFINEKKENIKILIMKIILIYLIH